MRHTMRVAVDSQIHTEMGKKAYQAARDALAHKDRNRRVAAMAELMSAIRHLDAAVLQGQRVAAFVEESGAEELMRLLVDNGIFLVAGGGKEVSEGDLIDE